MMTAAVPLKPVSHSKLRHNVEISNLEMRENTNKMQHLDVYYQHFLNMFRASLFPSSGEQDVCYCTWCAAL